MGPAGTARLRWRRPATSDLAELAALHSDPDVMRWIADPEPEEQVAGALERWSRPGDPRFGVWVAESSDADLVGWFSLQPQQAGDGILGYRLHRRFWGAGLATEGCAALLDHAFGPAGLDRVTAQTYQENLASQRVMAKLAMRLVRRFRPDAAELGGQPVWDGDELEYAITAGEWAQRGR